MSESPTPNWLNWVVPFLALLATLWAVVKSLFVQAVRAEMTDMHQANQARLLQIEHRVGDIESSIQRVLGRLQERWGDSQEE
jgi:hypothetical protein